MKMIVGLGNVGAQYAETRHNIGWLVVDAFALQYSLDFKAQSKLKAMVAKGQIGKEEVLLVKPTTMMNSSGEAVQAVAQFYKVEPTDIMVAYDELDIMFGTIKTKCGGGSRSHNGLNSVIQNLGRDFWRLKIGIDRQPRGIPNGKDFVLAKFTPDEERQLDALTDETNNLLEQQLYGYETTTKTVVKP